MKFSKIILIVPTGKGTIAKTAYNLYKSILENYQSNVYVIVINYKEDDDYKFENALVFKDSSEDKILKKVFYLISKLITIKKYRNFINADICISTLLISNTINILTKDNEKTIGIFHAPLSQTKILGKYIYYTSVISYKYLYPMFDKIVGVSNGISLDLKKNVKINKGKPIIQTVYNIHNIEEIRNKAILNIEPEYELLFEDDVILFIGTIDTNKSLDRLINAFSQLKPEVRRKSNIVVIGGYGKNGKLVHNQLLTLIKDLNLTTKVHFLGSKDNPYKYLKRAKMLVSSSYSEGLPGVLIEAQILNIPVVSTNSSFGVWEILSSQKDYDLSLNTYYVANKGIITSNISVNNQMYIDIDIKNLNFSINKILEDSNFYQELLRNPSDIERFYGKNILNRLINEK